MLNFRWNPHLSPRSFAACVCGVWTVARASGAAPASGMDGDAEARALLARFRRGPVSRPLLRKTFDHGLEAKKVAGPVAVAVRGEGKQHPTDRAASFAASQEPETYALYSLHVPDRGKASLDFRINGIPPNHNRMTVFSVGTPGNTQLVAKLVWPTAAGPVMTASIVTRRETVRLTSDPIALGPWHRVDWWFGPEGSVLLLDGVIHDFSTDWCVPWAAGQSSVLYLGDQPWWSQGKPAFYRDDGFVGQIDNLQVVGVARSKKEPDE